MVLYFVAHVEQELYKQNFICSARFDIFAPIETYERSIL